MHDCEDTCSSHLRDARGSDGGFQHCGSEDSASDGNNDSDHDSHKDDGGGGDGNDEPRDEPYFRASGDVDEASRVTLSAALLSDLETSHISPTPHAEQQTQSKASDCCVCGTHAMYTCPGCGRRTCSMICVRVHKEDFKCTGVRDVAVKVPLSEFTDRQLQRDYHFLENCRRVIDNIERCFPRTSWRYNYKALPPPLHALREAARRRGVICQIMSEGMRKRDENTSRLDRKTNTIVWRCEFEFRSAHDGAEVTTISTDWGSERHRLGDILKYCWATNPPLLCYHINRRYNRASKYVGESATKTAKGGEGEVPNETDPTPHDSAAAPLETAADAGSAAAPPTGVDVLPTAEVTRVASDEGEGDVPPPTVAAVEAEAAASRRECPLSAPAELLPLRAYEVVLPMPPIEPVTPREAQHQAFVQDFLTREKYVILSKAERLGNNARYFLLDPYDTLNENLRRLFFVSEFPVFVVVHASELHRFTLVTEEDKEAIRSSFRSKKTREPRERPQMRKRSEMEPEELERLSRVPCRRFLQGRCLNAEECPYWHCTPNEIPVCRTFLRFGECDKGTRCSFRHDADAVRIARKRQRDGLGENGSPMRGRGMGRDRGFGFGRLLDGARGRGGMGGGFYEPRHRTE
uniref:HIT_zinc_finger/Zinc_finger_C-x8-C-x5-C-x3-H_type _(And_similar)_putative/Pfam:PF04438/Pfam:PF00642 n=1 Tax=Leishmania donovani TaxID=5661 RepID=A0A6J8FGQ3_LEIDO|nr:HIT_zinc_finger/Zinc_finger_C-x8-C-x5-C-x3-H_type_(and_similar)_putative/Pfam:PF04438/Pfam:PF00642 [Leishmania donovani]